MELPPGARRFIPRDYLHLYTARMRIDVTVNLAYRGAVAIWLLGLILQPLVSLVVWTTVAESQGGTVSGFTTQQYAAYFIILMLVNNLVFTWVMWEFEWRIRTGFFSGVLLRPIHPIHQDVTQNLSFKVVGLIGVIPAAVILAIVFDADFQASLRDVLVFVPALVLAMAVHFITDWTLALIAFWITRTSAVFQFYNSVALFMTGNLAPLWLFPDVVQQISWFLPFRWMVYFPVEVLMGHLTGAELLRGLGMQLLWLAIALSVLQRCWRAASSRYAAVGG